MYTYIHAELVSSTHRQLALVEGTEHPAHCPVSPTHQQTAVVAGEKPADLQTCFWGSLRDIDHLVGDRREGGKEGERGRERERESHQNEHSMAMEQQATSSLLPPHLNGVEQLPEAAEDLGPIVPSTARVGQHHQRTPVADGWRDNLPHHQPVCVCGGGHHFLSHTCTQIGRRERDREREREEGGEEGEDKGRRDYM